MWCVCVVCVNVVCVVWECVVGGGMWGRSVGMCMYVSGVKG